MSSEEKTTLPLTAPADAGTPRAITRRVAPCTSRGFREASSMLGEMRRSASSSVICPSVARSTAIRTPAAGLRSAGVTDMTCRPAALRAKSTWTRSLSRDSSRVTLCSSSAAREPRQGCSSGSVRAGTALPPATADSRAALLWASTEGGAHQRDPPGARIGDGQNEESRGGCRPAAERSVPWGAGGW